MATAWDHYSRWALVGVPQLQTFIFRFLLGSGPAKKRMRNNKLIEDSGCPQRVGLDF